MLPVCLLLGFLPQAPAIASQDAPTHRATGVVLDADDRPLPGVAIEVTARLGIVPHSFEPRTVTDADGRFEVTWAVNLDAYCLRFAVGGGGLSFDTRDLVGDESERVCDLGQIVLIPAFPLELRLRDEGNQVLGVGWVVAVGLGDGDWSPARLDLGAGTFRIEGVPPGSFRVRVSRAGEPGPSFVTRVVQDADATVREVRVESRRQLWIEVDEPWPDSTRISNSLREERVVLAVTAEGVEHEAVYDPSLGLHLFDGLPAGPLELVVEGPRELRPYRARLPQRGRVTAPLRGSLDLEVVLLEQGAAGPLGQFAVETTIERVEVSGVEGRASKRVEGLVPGIGQLEMYLPGSARPRVVVDLARLSEEERRTGRIERTLPNWSGLSGRVVDRTPAASAAGVIVEILSIGEDGSEQAAGLRLDLDRGANYRFSRLLPGPHVVRVWWARQHWQDFSILVAGAHDRLDLERESPGLLEVVHPGGWPDELGLVVHHPGAPPTYPGVTTRRPSSEGPPSRGPSSEVRFGPLELRPGDVELSVACHDSGRTWLLERVSIVPGMQVRAIQGDSLPALVRWTVVLDGASVVGGCRSNVSPVGTAPSLRRPLPMGADGARHDRMLVAAGDWELVLTGEDGTWGARADLSGLRPGETREVEVEITRVRRTARFLVDQEPLRDAVVLLEVATPDGLLRRKVTTDANGEAQLAFVAGELAAWCPGVGGEVVRLDWSVDLPQETLAIVLR